LELSYFLYHKRKAEAIRTGLYG